MGMSDRIFGTYTTNNRKRILNIVRQVNGYAKSFASIPMETKEKPLKKYRVKITTYDYGTNSSTSEYVEMNEEEYAFYNKTEEFRKRLRTGESIESIMPEALAVCREATKRAIGMYPYDVQIEAAVAMQDNTIAEMKTGEGKSLVQILSAYLNVLEATKSKDRRDWKSVHIFTANEHLASRDQQENAPVYALLGLTSGYAPSQDAVRADRGLKEVKKRSYDSDIVYGTAKTIAFDYLDDNHIYKREDKFIRRGTYHAIVDEADDILLDQATRPLILSSSVKSNGTTTESVDVYDWAARFIDGEPGYRKKPVTCHIFAQYERSKTVGWKEDCVLYQDQGYVDLSERLYKEIYAGNPDLSDPDVADEYNNKARAVMQCLLAKYHYSAGKQYQIFADPVESAKDKEHKVVKLSLTDTFTGRTMDQTRYQGGMQEAIEAVESLRLEKSQRGLPPGSKKTILKTSALNVPIAKCTYPDFLRMYDHGVSGMTGTSDIEEFRDIYKMDTYEVPSRKKNIRVDSDDELYATIEQKHKAILEEVLRCQRTKQPILIGTTNVEESDMICEVLKANGIRFQRLDAVNKSNEDGIKKTAGLLGSVTVATNMAGRGINIKLGEGVREVGGLYVIGTSKNKSKRIDNQLRGRAARQGEPGRTKYFMSLRDPLIETRFGSDKLDYFARTCADEKGRITNKRVIALADRCQEIEEGYSKQTRKQSEMLEEKVFTQHKKEIYRQREQVLNADYKELVRMLQSMIKTYVDGVFEEDSSYENVDAKLGHLVKTAECYSDNKKEFKSNLINKLMTRFKYAPNGDISKYIESTRKKMLKVIDDYWVSHMDYLIDTWKNASYYSYSNMDPVEIYQRESYRMLQSMNPFIQNEMITYALNPAYAYGTYSIKETQKKEKGKTL